MAALDGKLQRYAADVRGRIEEESDEPSGQPKREIPAIEKVQADDLPGARCRLVGPEGNVLASDTVFKLLAAQNILFLNTMGHFTATIDGLPYRVIRALVEIDERPGYLLEVVAPTTEADTRLTHLRLLLLGAVPASLFLAALAAFFITRSALRPIVAMTKTARLLCYENLDKRIPVPVARDEVRTLAETLNGMIERIDSAFRSQKQFVADASHELRTPLTVITTELEFAERSAQAATKESIHVALAETERLAHIAGNLLLLARLDAPQVPMTREPVRLDQLLAECAQRMARSAAKKNMRIELKMEGPVEIAGDQTRLKGAF